MVRDLVSLTWVHPLTCTKVTDPLELRVNQAMAMDTPATSRDRVMEVQEFPMIPEVTMDLVLEASILAMDRPLQARASIPLAMLPLKEGPRPLDSQVSCPLVTPDIGWRDQEEELLDMDPDPLTQEARQDMAPMAPATMALAILLATPLLLASIQEDPQELQEDTVDPLDQEDTAQRGLTVITIPLVTDKSSLLMWRPRDLMVSLCMMRPANSRHCPSHLTTRGEDKHPRGTMAR